MEPLLTAHELARDLRISVHTVHRLLRKGKLPAYQIAGVGWRFDRREIEQWIKQRTVERKQ